MFAFIVTLLMAVVIGLGPPTATAQTTTGPPEGSELVQPQTEAQESTEAAGSTEPSIGEEAEELGPVVVTATKTAVPLSLSPFSTEVISGRDVEENQVPSVKEALRGARGLHVVQTGRGGGTTAVRVRGGESDHNLVLLDGIPLNDDGGGFDWAHLTTDNVERIEVLRGAGSALYGSDALASVIHIITKEGDGPPTLTLSTAFGDQGTDREAASLRGSRPGMRYSFSLSRFDTDGFFEPNDFYENMTARGKVSLALTDHSKATFTAHYLERRNGAPDQTGFFVFDRSHIIDGDQLAIGLTLDQQLFSWLDHSVFVAVMDKNEFGDDPRDDAPSIARRPEATVLQATVADSALQTTEDLQRRIADYHLNVSVTSHEVQTVLTGGVEGELEDGQEGGASGVTFNDERRNLGYYGQAQFNWRDRVIIVPGVRQEDNEVFGGETVPRVAAALILGDPADETWVGPLKIKGSWGEGIKEPSFFESFNPTFGNPGLAPEKTVHWDAGGELTLCRGACFVEVVYFHVNQRNKIEFIDNTYKNIGKARAEGIEIFGSLEPFDWLRIEGQYTHLDTVVKRSSSPEDRVIGLDKELLRRPNDSGSGSIVGRLGPVTVRGDVIVVGDRFDRDGVFDTSTFKGDALGIFHNPGYTRVDLAARLRLENQIVKLWGSPFPHAVEAFARAENLLDEDYEEVLGYPAPGINVLAGVQVTLQGAPKELSQAPKKSTVARR
jgi:vitamin B12 transporter